MFFSASSLCGSGVDAKEKTGGLMTCATSLTGLSGTTSWARPILDYWGLLNFNKVRRGRFKPLAPNVDND